jgi:hypothetical protein
MKMTGGTLFALLFLCLFAGALYLCTGWPPEARFFPLLIVVAGIGLCGVVLRSEMSLTGFTEIREGGPERDKLKAVLRGTEQKATPRREAVMILWVSAFLIMVLILGFWIGMAVFMPLFMHWFGRENWKIIALYTAGMWLAIYLTFAVGMRVSLFEGILGLSL